MKTIAWLLKNVIIPLSPFTIGAGFRIFYAGGPQWSCFSPTELAFSIAMMFLILSASSTKLTDPALKDALSSGFTLGVIVFLALFAIALSYKTDVTASLETFVAASQAQMQMGIAPVLSDIPATLGRSQLLLGELRIIIVIAAAGAVLFSIVVGTKYDLMQT